MKSKQRIAALILILLLGAAAFALVRTRTSQPAFLAPTTANPAEPELVDQKPLQTAQQFAKMPTSEEEKPFAQQALELGDKEMDSAFADAVLDAQLHPPVPTPQAKAIQAR